MTMHRTTMLATLTAAAALALAACSTQEGPAAKAIADAQAALNALQEDAAKHVPGDLVAAQKALAEVKQSLAERDYAAVLAATPALATKIAALKEGVAAKKAEFESAVARARDEWAPLAGELPKMVESIQKRIDELSQSARLPRGMDPGQFEGAKTGLETIKTTWSEATAAFESGNVVDAVAKANEAKAKSAEVMTALGMTAT